MHDQTLCDIPSLHKNQNNFEKEFAQKDGTENKQTSLKETFKNNFFEVIIPASYNLLGELVKFLLFKKFF
jgi:CobQ-like glutamine amidotransferase family enzyme